MTGDKSLPSTFYGRPVLEVAPALLNKVLTVGERRGRIVEVEAYGGEDDPGSHAWRGPTPRTELMYGPAGHWYIYLSYGVHWCANVVVDGPGTAAAVLIRAVEPLAGIDEMRAARGKVRDRDLANGPGKLTQAFGFGQEVNGQSIADSPVRIIDDGVAPPTAPVRTPRIGLSKDRAPDRPWRFTPD
jgi:DNA-3-methyladenine glycosylase